MFIQMLKNQHVKFVSNVEEAAQYSPFNHWYNDVSGRYVVSKGSKGPCVAAGKAFYET